MWAEDLRMERAVVSARNRFCLEKIAQCVTETGKEDGSKRLSRAMGQTLRLVARYCAFLYDDFHSLVGRVVFFFFLNPIPFLRSSTSGD